MSTKKPRILRILAALFVALLVVAGYLAFSPVPIEPQAWSPTPVAPLTGPLVENREIEEQAVRWASGLVQGPEDVAIKDGILYTGLEDGRIVQITLGSGETEQFADTGGRPLGLEHDADGNLIVADAMQGLLSISPEGDITVLTDRVDGKKMIFADDLDVADDGVIWFSDASQRFGYGKQEWDFWEGSATGRLLTYDPTTQTTRVVLDGLRFANGVAIAPDQTFVLVAETFARRIHKHWLIGEKAGETEVLVDALPAYPDNISAASDGLFWVALPIPVVERLERLHPKPFTRSVLFRLYRLGVLSPQPSKGWFIAIDEQGNVVGGAMDPSGETFYHVTSVNEFDGELFLGSNVTDSIGRMPVPTSILPARQSAGSPSRKP